MRARLFLLLCAWMPCVLSGQGIGGGMYLEDGAFCTGSVIRGNQAIGGYGVGGGNGTLQNATVVNNQKLQMDMSSILPGHIYCADGAIVDTTEYKESGRTDAVGVVYWIRVDADAPWPAGAVVALEEIEGPWGLGNAFTDWQAGTPLYDNHLGTFHMFDTACYQTTRKIWEADGQPAAYDAVTSAYDAATFCHTFKAQEQSASKPMSWALPTYLYLRRLFAAFPIVENTLGFLERQQPALTIDFLRRGKTDAMVAWYWSCTDMGALLLRAYSVNFVSGETGNSALGYNKDRTNRIRPVLIY